jgi:uncharacterized protein YecE (DUF72 family)
MKFGTVPPEQLDHIVYTLPADAAVNAQVLPGRPSTLAKTWLGASSWGDKSWVGPLYPPPTPATRYRERYPLHFNALELNATHYAIYEANVMAQWAAAAQGRAFRFCAKMPQAISHYSGFRNVGDITHAFLESLSGLGKEHLGPIFLQLPDSFGPARQQELFDYLAGLPEQYDVFLELRHPAWMADLPTREALFETLRALRKGIVLADTPGRRDLVHMALTVPRFFLRFVCPGLHRSSFDRTDAWLKRLNGWFSQGLEEAYIFLHPGEETAFPEIYKYWHRHLFPDQPRPSAPVQGGLFG